MSFQNLALRYANAFYVHATKQNVRSQVIHDIKNLQKAYTESPAFQAFIQSPLHTPKDKVHKVHTTLQKKIQPTTITFLSFLITKKREALLPEILKEVDNIHKATQHIRTVYLTTTHHISPTLKKEITQHIQHITSNEPIELIEKIDSSLIGGYILKVNNLELDMSIRTQLERLKQHWEQSPLPILNPTTV